MLDPPHRPTAPLRYTPYFSKRPAHRAHSALRLADAPEDCVARVTQLFNFTNKVVCEKPFIRVHAFII